MMALVDEAESMATLVEMAKLLEQCERYDEMATCIKKFAIKTSKLTDEQRNLFSVAFKNVVGARRSAWRIIGSIASKQQDKGEGSTLAKTYQAEIEKELEDRIDEVLYVLNNTLIRSVDDTEHPLEAKVFYLKMKADYLRYLTEIVVGEKRRILMNKAKVAYNESTKEAEELPSTHPIKLGLCLNYSVFQYEILNDCKMACDLAKKAFDDAIAELDHLKEESYKDSTLIMQLLRDNLTLWTSEDNNADDDNAQ
jgi:hypothetical protein